MFEKIVGVFFNGAQCIIIIVLYYYYYMYYCYYYYCIVFNLYIYIAPLALHTNQKWFQCERPREKRTINYYYYYYYYYYNYYNSTRSYGTKEPWKAIALNHWIVMEMC